MPQWDILYEQVHQLNKGIVDMMRFVRSREFHFAEERRPNLASLYAEIEDDLRILEIDREFVHHGKTLLIFDAALKPFLPREGYETGLDPSVRSDALHAAVQTLEKAEGKIMRRIKQLTSPVATIEPSQPETGTRGREIFLVHGHDAALKHAVARLMEQLGLEPIILEEQPNLGRTLIEKIERYKDATYAVVLLTPDDVGGTSEDDLRPRARQNVVLELGFFIGAMGRQNVAVLHAGNLELPSDIEGVAYIPAEGDSWHLKLGKELKGADFEIDLNLLAPG